MVHAVRAMTWGAWVLRPRRRSVFMICLTAVLGCGLGGCASGLAGAYEGAAPGELALLPGYIHEGRVIIRGLSTGVVEAVAEMGAKGYALVGHAAWEAGEAEGESVERDARSQALKIGASQVLWESTWSRVRHGVVPLIHRTPGTSVTTYGPHGYTQVSTPHTTNVNLVSYAYDIFDYLVLFFARWEPQVLGGQTGLGLGTPDMQLRRRLDTQGLESDAAARVRFVLSGSPAERAHIFAGDIILSWPGGGAPGSALPSGRHTLRIWRDGHTLTRVLEL